jgi:hypothetical protein
MVPRPDTTVGAESFHVDTVLFCHYLVRGFHSFDTVAPSICDGAPAPPNPLSSEAK